MLSNLTYNPDVLSCLANLSSDEVFTPPELVNQMLDLLPESLWSDKNATFLDPACKSGVFLREIARRLDKGLEESIPDRQKRIDHIFTNQLFGLSITELTALLARRSVYCSKTANGKYSVCPAFKDSEGNIRFEKVHHTWDSGRCTFCGANEAAYERGEELESHAYSFIHTETPEELFNMKFDVIIGNPPYQLGDGGNNASATPIYNKFVENAKKMNPNYLVMIIPARWYCGGRGLEQFRKSMLTDKHLMAIHDYADPSEIFPKIRVGGGVCFFLWSKNYSSPLVEVYTRNRDAILQRSIRPTIEYDLDFFIRDSIAVDILHKVMQKNEPIMSEQVFSQKPYGFRTNFSNFKEGGDTKIYTKQTKKGFAYIDKSSVLKNANTIEHWKVVTSRSTSVPEEDNGQVLRISQTFIAEPGSVVSESYVLIYISTNRNEAENCLTYVMTKFFRFLCQVVIVSPDVSVRTFSLVPQQSFKEVWTDNKLYGKYGLSEQEIMHIEAKIKPWDQQ